MKWSIWEHIWSRNTSHLNYYGNYDVILKFQCLKSISWGFDFERHTYIYMSYYSIIYFWFFGCWNHEHFQVEWELLGDDSIFHLSLLINCHCLNRQADLVITNWLWCQPFCKSWTQGQQMKALFSDRRIMPCLSFDVDLLHLPPQT